jgi:DNA-directed RNA polymerase subunit RPC12/RpoP
MAKLINAKCPNCGATLELPETLDRAFCMHCGGKVIIAKDEIHQHKSAIACPECRGVGYHPCTNCDGNGICNWFLNYRGLREKMNYHGNAGSLALHKLAAKCNNGRCSRCNGIGKIPRMKRTQFFDKGGRCPACGSTGKCPQCKGTGKCSCKGSGKIKCEPCDGTGFKVYEGV